MINSDSRYSSSNVYTVNQSLGVQRTLIDSSSRPPTKFSRSVTHRFIQGDTLEDISYRYYGDAMQWWLIADANKFSDPLNIPIGTLLDIPDLTTVTLA